MKKGQITIYLTLIFTLILSVFLSAFEAARGSHLKIRMENAVQTAIHSTFGEYHRVLFERYGLLFVDTSYMSSIPDYHKMEGRMEEYLEFNLKPETEQKLLFARDWYGIQDCNVTLSDIRVATDDNGNVMKQQAVDYIQNYVGGNWIEEVQSWIAITESEQLDSNKFQAYQEELDNDYSTDVEGNNLLGVEWTTGIGLPSFDFLNTYVDSGVWETIMPGFEGISVKAFNPLEHASYRKNIQGTEALENKEIDITQELFFGEYIMQKMGNYRNVREGSKLDYQVEYILFGNAQDSVNFGIMLESLFLFRGTANLVMLLADTETQEWIKGISELGTLVYIPPEVLVVLINVCWAGAESVTDVKRLIKGDKVALLKEPKDFAVGVECLLAGMHGNLLVDENAQNGKGPVLGYEDYLRIFLYFIPSSTKSMRCMDMIEADIRLTEGNENFRMDACVDAIGMEIGITDGYGHFYTMNRKYSYF